MRYQAIFDITHFQIVESCAEIIPPGDFLPKLFSEICHYVSTMQALGCVRDKATDIIIVQRHKDSCQISNEFMES